MLNGSCNRPIQGAPPNVPSSSVRLPSTVRVQRNRAKSERNQSEIERNRSENERNSESSEIAGLDPIHYLKGILGFEVLVIFKSRSYTTYEFINNYSIIFDGTSVTEVVYNT
jgi:hypothetical protein